MEYSVSDDGVKEIEDSMLNNFLERELAKCDVIMSDFEGLLSLVEMELSFLSSKFVYSCFSTWRYCRQCLSFIQDYILVQIF